MLVGDPLRVVGLPVCDVGVLLPPPKIPVLKNIPPGAALLEDEGVDLCMFNCHPGVLTRGPRGVRMQAARRV